MLVKLIVVIGLSILYSSLFGEAGILGVSAIAFTVAMISMNPALYISLMDDVGTDADKAAFGFTGLFSIPIIPVMIYSFGGNGAFDWMPIISTIVPLLLGIILGNLDHDFRDMFGGAVPILLPLLGWNMGQSMNLLDSLKAGASGLVLAALFYAVNSILVLIDKQVLKNDGAAAMAMNSVAALSTSVPAVVALAHPEVEPFVTSAVAQILMASVISVFVTPAIVRKMTNK